MVSKDGPSQVSLASIHHSRGREDCAARSGSILQERARRQRASAVLASSTGSVGTDLTDAWVVGNSPWTGEMGGCERRSPSLKAPPFCELELGHPPPSPREKRRPILSDRLGFPPIPRQRYHSSQPIREEILPRKELQLGMDKPGEVLPTHRSEQGPS